MPDAIVTPTVVDRRRRRFTGCVYDDSGRLVRASQRRTRNVLLKPADPERIDVAIARVQLDGDCLYLGHYATHYGHFLLETLSRFWALEPYGNADRFLFQPFVHRTLRPRSYPPADVCLDCFGVDPGRVSFIRRPTRVRRLILPAALVDINTAADRRQGAVYRRIAACCDGHVGSADPAVGTRPPRIYLSRKGYRRIALAKRWKRARPVANEDGVEELFASLGFRVVHPERIPFAEQVAMYGGAEVVAGFPGSALHNAVFMRPGALLIEIATMHRRPNFHVNQRMCEEMAGVRSCVIPFEGRAVDAKERLGEIDVERLRDRVEELLATT